MYFLKQIKEQFLASVINYDVSPTDGFTPGSDDVVDKHIAVNQVELDIPVGAEQLAFQELNEELDAIDNDSGLVNRYTNILGNFLVKVRNGEITGLSEEDSDFQRLLSLYKNKFEELKDMRNRGQEIEHVINFEISRLNETVDKGTAGENIDSMLDTAYEEQVEDREQQEELKRLETQRESHEGISRELLSSYSPEQQEVFSEGIKTHMSKIQRYFEKEPNGEGGEKYKEVTTEDRNNEIGDELKILGMYLEYESIRGSINIALTKIPSELISDELKARHTDYVNRDFLNPETKERDLDAARIEGIGEGDRRGELSHGLLQELYGLIALTEDNEKALEELTSKYEAAKKEINDKLVSFIGKEDNTQSMDGALEQNERVQRDNFGGMTEYEQLQILQGDSAFASLDSLKRLTDIALRDTGVVGENGEKLGDVRLDSAHEAYNKILEDEAIKIALSLESGEAPTFEELRMDHIKKLRENEVDLAQLFLVDEKGESFTGELEEGKTYLINLSTNTELAGEIDFVFISGDFEKISVDGDELEFKTNHFENEGNSFKMLDGSMITLDKKFGEDEGAQNVRYEAINTEVDRLALNSAQRTIIDAALISNDPTAIFESGDVLLKGLLGMLVAVILNLGDGRNFKYDEETGTWREDNNEEGKGLTNGDIAAHGIGNYQIDGAGLEEQPDGVKGLVGMIYQKESRGNPNIMFGHPNPKVWPEKPLTEMTIREVQVYQRKLVAAGSESAAVGAPQIITKTMNDAIANNVFDVNEKFDMEAQNRFTIWKLNQRGLGAYKSGSIDEMQFMKRISMEWASFPEDMGGESYHKNVGSNRALISPQQVLGQIRSIRS